jgi:hypothetical protein
MWYLLCNPNTLWEAALAFSPKNKKLLVYFELVFLVDMIVSFIEFFFLESFWPYFFEENLILWKGQSFVGNQNSTTKY